MSYAIGTKCLHCGKEYPMRLMGAGCPACRTSHFVSSVSPTYGFSDFKRNVNLELFERRPPSGVWRFRELLPIPEEHQVTLGEGNTPLLHCPTLGARIGLKNLYVKDEGRNPTHSFKDRQAAVAISWAKMTNAPGVAVSSSGNHGSAYAAFAARAGVPYIIFSFKEASPVQRTQMQALGAKVIGTPHWPDRWKLVGICVDEFGWQPGSNYTDPAAGTNPIGIEGYKTIGYEIILQLGGKVPDRVIFPCGHGDSIYGAWRGFSDFYELGLVGSRPKMIASESFGPLTKTLREELSVPVKVPMRPTVALSFSTDSTTYHAMRTVQDSGGTADTVTDEEIMEAQRELSNYEGVYSEPSSVAPVALAKKHRAMGMIEENEVVVCFLTASGLKDQKATAKTLPQMPDIPPEKDALVKALKDTYDFSLVN